MTREEAINELEILKEDYWDDDGYGHETKQYDDTMLALDIAIKALEQEPTTKNDLEIVISAMEYRTNALIENIKTEIMHFANMHCSGDDVNIYDVFKVIDDCCEVDNPTIKNDLGVDAVSRQAVLDLIADYDLSMGQVVKGIHALPSVTLQELRWIPVSERLPEPNARDGLIARYYLIQNEYGDMLVARYDGKGWEQMYQHKYLEDEVIAWMPLPKAYREVEE